MLFSQFPLTFHLHLQHEGLFHHDYSHDDWDGLRDPLRDIPWEDIFKLGTPATAREFCE